MFLIKIKTLHLNKLKSNLTLKRRQLDQVIKLVKKDLSRCNKVKTKIYTSIKQVILLMMLILRSKVLKQLVIIGIRVEDFLPKKKSQIITHQNFRLRMTRRKASRRHQPRCKRLLRSTKNLRVDFRKSLQNKEKKDAILGLKRHKKLKGM